MNKQRWIKFSAWGGEVVKGEKPEGFSVPAPDRLPHQIPMHYWKWDEATQSITEMSDVEKKASDESCAEIPLVRQVGNEVPAKPTQNIVNCNHKCKPVMHTTVVEEVDLSEVEHDLDLAKQLLEDLNVRLSSVAKRVCELESKPEPKIPAPIESKIYNINKPVQKLSKADWLKITLLAASIAGAFAWLL